MIYADRKPIKKTAYVMPHVTLPEGGMWATDARNAALSSMSEFGMPQKRDEYWRYTDPTALTSDTPPPASIFDADELALFDNVDRVKLFFVDGLVFFLFSEGDSSHGRTQHFGFFPGKKLPV